MNKIALGTVQFGMKYGVGNQDSKPNKLEITKILKLAKSYGVNCLDTASSYGNSEKIIGSIGLEEFDLITKTRHFSNKTLSSLDASNLLNDFSKSQSLLNKEQIYGLLVHSAEDLLKPGSSVIYDQMIKIKELGLVKKIGVSVYSNYQINEIVSQFDIDLIQIPINILDRALIYNGSLKKLAGKGIEIHARSIFLQGLLLMDRDKLPMKFNRWKPIWDLWYEWLKDNNISALQASLNFAISISEISKVLVGVNSLSEFEKIFTCEHIDLPELPESFYTDDRELLNPTNWDTL